MKNARFWRPTRSFILWSSIQCSSPLLFFCHHSEIKTRQFLLPSLCASFIEVTAHIFQSVILFFSIRCIWLVNGDHCLPGSFWVSWRSFWKVLSMKGQFINYNTPLPLDTLDTLWKQIALVLANALCRSCGHSYFKVPNFDKSFLCVFCHLGCSKFCVELCELLKNLEKEKKKND